MFFTAEIIPLFIIFVVVMTLRLKLTTGVAQSFLFFAQMLFITNHLPPLRPLSDTVNLFYRIHTFIVGFFSMFFFYLDELSFCVWSGTTKPQVITFYFVTTLFSLLLLISFVVIVHHKSQSLLMHCSCLKTIVQKMNNLHDSLVHGLSAFFILLHSQYTLLSFTCLTKFHIYGKGGTTERTVVLEQGYMEYFEPAHLPYAIPALFVLVFFSLPLPLLLISYPLLWKVKARLRHSAEERNEATLWVIRKLLPFIDSFQGVFRDNCRYFAGLFFIWRVILYMQHSSLFYIKSE